MKKSLFLFITLLLASCSNLKDSSPINNNSSENHSKVEIFNFSLEDVKEIIIMHTAMSSPRFWFSKQMIEQFYGYITQEDYVICKSVEGSICTKMNLDNVYYYYHIFTEGHGSYKVEYYNGYFIVDRAYHTNIPIKLDDSLLIGNLVPGYKGG